MRLMNDNKFPEHTHTHRANGFMAGWFAVLVVV